MLTWRRCLLLGAAAAIAAHFIGFDTIRRKAAEVVIAAWHEASGRLVEQDLARLAARVDGKAAALDCARRKQQELRAQLGQMRGTRAALGRKLEEDREILSQIGQLLRSQPSSTISIDGVAYQRAAIEADAKTCIDRIDASGREIAGLDASIAEMDAGVERIEAALTSAGGALANQRALYARLRAQDCSRQLRREVNTLLAAGGEAGSVDPMAEEVATLLQPLADTPRPAGDPPGGGDRDVINRIAASLAALKVGDRPR